MDTRTCSPLPWTQTNSCAFMAKPLSCSKQSRRRAETERKGATLFRPFAHPPLVHFNDALNIRSHQHQLIGTTRENLLAFSSLTRPGYISMEEAEKDEYELLEAIGSGSFGVIRKVRRKADGRVNTNKYSKKRQTCSFIRTGQANKYHVTLIDLGAERNRLSQNEHTGKGATGGRSQHPQGSQAPQHCRVPGTRH